MRVLVARFTRETANVMHDLFVLPTGRTYYRRNMGYFETEIPPGVGALSDLRACNRELNQAVVHHLKGEDMFGGIRALRKKVEEHRCSLGTQYLELDASAL